MEPSVKLALVASSVFMLLGLLTGVWRYSATIRSTEAQAPRYVNVSHSASLMYSFACIVLLELARVSRWPAGVELAAVGVPVSLFAVATGTYILHAALKDSDNQFRMPYRIGSRRLSPGVFEAGG
jgi:hypothetical protein